MSDLPSRGVQRSWTKPVDLTVLSDEEHVALATELYERWNAGAKKSPLEVEFFDNATSHGKFFSAYLRKWLGVETEHRSGQSEYIARLESLLRANGVSPGVAGDLAEEFRLLAKARESALAALRIYNDPLSGFRSESFIVLMVIGWNSLMQAILERDGVDYYDREPSGRVIEINGRGKVKDTAVLIDLALAGDQYCSVRANLDFFLGLRNLIAHRYLPALDTSIVGEAQAMLLNFERLLVEQFGEQAKLGEQLAVPLQLSGFRNPGGSEALKRAQALLPVDVMNFLSAHRAGQPDHVLRSPEYSLQIFFVPVTANRERSADVVARFFRPGEVPDRLTEGLRELDVVTKPKQVPVASGDLLRPAEVVNLVAGRLPYRFTMDTHTRCWRHYNVRPASGSAEPEATDPIYCRWDRLSNGYGYTQAWVDRVVNDLGDAQTYEAVVGVPADLR